MEKTRKEKIEWLIDELLDSLTTNVDTEKETIKKIDCMQTDEIHQTIKSLEILFNINKKI